MDFITDKQTLEDLNIVGKYKNNSIFNVFNHVTTRGAERVLETMFLHPLSDAGEINKRSATFRYFQENQIRFPFKKELFETVEHYIGNSCHGNPIVAALNIYRCKFLQKIAADKEFEIRYAGLAGTLEFLHTLRNFIAPLYEKRQAAIYADTLEEADGILRDKQLKQILEAGPASGFSLWQIARYDYILRCVCLEKIKKLMDIIYLTDIYATVAHVAGERRFAYATATSPDGSANRSGSHIRLTRVFHPQLLGAVPNTVCVDCHRNVIFLTGANMAGKSTFMKSFGIAVYLAHMGFPVAAEAMEFSVQDGIYTSINVPDNLDMGYSHFYAEVLRVKKVAEEVSRSKNLVIIFDELFKGTNVKDAYDATVAVSEAFAGRRNCSYIISTHITEAGHTLKEHCPNMKFVFFPTVMEGNTPRYTYTLQEGITSDRHGMMIINNEHIIDIIDGKQ